jgi:polysaccharide biosynthesis/export protein
MQAVARIRAFFAAVLCLACVACASYGPDDSAHALSQMPAAQTQYQLGPGDQLRVTVFGEEDLTGEYLVGAQGKIAFPLIGEFDAAGLTTDELAANLGQRLRQGYVRQPNISVQVANYRPFYILGEVQRPGTYPFSANLTVMSAVATAGGFTYRASTSRVFIKHAGEQSERNYPLSSGTAVLPGDTVRVAERYF